MSFTDLKNIHAHPVYLFGDKVAEICKPLFDRFPISYFTYVIRYPGNELILLTSVKNWVRYYIQSDHPFLCGY